MAQCTAHARSGRQCAQPAIPGGTVCRYHGGSAPQVKAMAARRLEMEAAADAVATFGLPIDITPTEALLAEVQWSAGHVAWLREKVREIDGADALVFGTTEKREKTGGEDWGKTQVEKAAPSVWVELYYRERRHLVEVSAAALRAGVEERRVKLAEQQGNVVIGVIKAILGDLNLTPEQAARIPEVVPRRLRLAAVDGAAV